MAVENPILVQIPLPILTPRLALRAPAPGDGAGFNAAILESFDDLKAWMPWAQARPSVEDTEIVCRRAAAKFLLREDLMLLVTDRKSGEILGGSGLHRINWEVPRFEIGYWMRSSRQNQGLVQESTNALTRFAIDALGAKRVEIRTDQKNIRSARVIEALGFRYEACLTNDDRNEQGELRNTLVYSRIDLEGLPPLEVSWG